MEKQAFGERYDNRFSPDSGENEVFDYLIAPKRAYFQSPLLCAVEAKKDDFEGGEMQCIAEMVACRWQNEQSGFTVPIYGIVTNGSGWQFYSLTLQNDVLQSEQFGIANLSDLLGAVDYVCGECAKNVPKTAIR